MMLCMLSDPYISSGMKQTPALSDEDFPWVLGEIRGPEAAAEV